MVCLVHSCPRPQLIILPHLDIYSIIPSSTRRSSRIIEEYPLHCMMIKMKLMIKGFVNESNDHHIASVAVNHQKKVNFTIRLITVIGALAVKILPQYQQKRFSIFFVVPITKLQI